MMRELAAFLISHDDIAVIGHISPDGDALGSAIAMRMALNKLGKRAAVVNVDPVPKMYDFLPGADSVFTPDTVPFAPRCRFLMDVAAPDRAGDHGVYEGLPSAQIDHHGTNPKAFPISVVDGDAAATGVMTLALLDELGVALDADIALCLYAAISTDTGNFSFPNTNPPAFRAAARLLETGFDIGQASYKLFRMRSVERTRLLGAALDALELYEGGRIAMTRVSGEMFEKCRADFPQTEGIVQALAEIRGVEAAIVAEYRKPGETKFSLRSSGELDVSKIARSMQGGGHHNAAGMSVYQDVNPAAEYVLGVVRGELLKGQ